MPAHNVFGCPHRKPNRIVANVEKAKSRNSSLGLLRAAVSTENVIVQCPDAGMREQVVVDKYIAETIPKLASGAFGVLPRDTRQTDVPVTLPRPRFKPIDGSSFVMNLGHPL
jgi:hypothetical protein